MCYNVVSSILKVVCCMRILAWSVLNSSINIIEIRLVSTLDGAIRHKFTSLW